MGTFDHFNDYEARKVCTSREEMEASLQKLQRGAPEWFQWELGFTFHWDNSVTVLLGFGGYRTTHLVDGRRGLGFAPAGILFTYLYKGEWHFADMSRMEDFKWEDCAPIDQETQHGT